MPGNRELISIYEELVSLVVYYGRKSGLPIFQQSCTDDKEYYYHDCCATGQAITLTRIVTDQTLRVVVLECTTLGICNEVVCPGPRLTLQTRLLLLVVGRERGEGGEGANETVLPRTPDL